MDNNNNNNNNNAPVRCPQCTNVVTGRFCSFCGTDLNAYNAQNAQPQYTQPQYTQQPYSQPQYAQQPYSQPVVQKKKNKLFAVMLSIIAVVLFFTAAMLLLSLIDNTLNIAPNENRTNFTESRDSSAYHLSVGVSASEFSKLEKGMTYAHITSIIGGDGQLVDGGKNLAEEDYYTYAWPGEDNENAIVYITIIKDVVSEITVEGTLDKQ